MNARAVHKLMRRLFPSGIPGTCSYKVVLDENNQPRLDVLRGMLVEQFQDDEIVVEVNRTVGGVFTHAEALGLIASNMSKSKIKVSNRDFNRFVVVESNGVATGFSKAQLFA